MELDKKTTKNIIKIAICIIVFAFLLYNISSVLTIAGNILGLVSPLLIGAVMAFIINVPMDFFEKKCFFKIKKKGVKRAVSIVCAFVTILLVIAIVMGLVIPEIASTVQLIISEFPARMTQAQIWMNDMLQGNEELNAAVAQTWIVIENYLLDLLNSLDAGNISGGVITAMTGAISGTVSAVINFFMAIIFSLYILGQKEVLASQGKRIGKVILKDTAYNKLFGILKLTSDTFRKFITGQCTEAVILGVIFFVAMSIFGMPYALTISVLIMLMSLIPIFGSFVGCIAGAFLILFVNPLQAIGFVVMFLIIQQIEGNLIYPHVVGNSIGLPSIWVFVAVLLGGNLFGIIGMLVFIPLSSVGYTLFKNWVKTKEKKKEKEEKDGSDCSR